MKGKILTNITKDETVFIDPQTGGKLTQEEFSRRYKKTGGLRLGGFRKAIRGKKGTEKKS